VPSAEVATFFFAGAALPPKLNAAADTSKLDTTSNFIFSKLSPSTIPL